MSDLTDIYRSYLDVLNERRFPALDQYVHDTVTYNGTPLTRQQYADLIENDARVIPDLRFVPELLTATDDVVACRLWFDCTPEHEFAGITPTGRRVAFAEHVFYRFRDDRIEQVWSLIDVAAVRDQMRNSDG
ncbi:ester cyclase [Kineosporia mesophila]|uniref:Ester cyclase n=1 Tax=Kineosporia mesophila TaxID=566012 RepID=A0ABP7ALQ8_9ACTN|nr:ester cyclase [Kineosporia mesophila]MCD5354023.1 ester cyclase [Kineosporia mesophila]